MRIPEEFYDFCLYLHQDFDLYGPEPQDWINGAMLHMDNASRLVLRDYLNELLSGDYSDAQLEEIYRSTDSELRLIYGLRYFLGMVRDTIDENLRPGAPDRIEIARQALLQRLRDED